MFGYIYLTTNKINGKKYIGKHKAVKFEPNKYIGSGRIFLKALRKYGKKNFDNVLIEMCDSEDELNNREKYWISFYNAMDSLDFYNVSEGGNGASSGERNPSKSTSVRRKISENNAMKNPIYKQHLRDSKLGKPLPHTQEWNEKIGNALRGRKLAPMKDEVKQKIGLANSGKNNGMYGKSAVVGTRWYNNGIKNVRAKECPSGFVLGVLKKGVYPNE